MIVIYDPSGHWTEPIRAALPDQRQVTTAEEWDHFLYQLRSATCAVVAVRDLRGRERALVADLKSRLPTLPVVLVTSSAKSNARLLKDIWIEEVVWIRELESEVEPVVDRAMKRAHVDSFLQQLAKKLERARLPVALRAAVVHAFRAVPPAPSVEELAEAVDKHRSTLWRHWQNTVPCAEKNLSDVIVWVLLLRAATGKTPSRSWDGVARDLGVRRDRLENIAKRLVGLPLSEVEARGIHHLIDRFRADLEPCFPHEIRQNPANSDK